MKKGIIITLLILIIIGSSAYFLNKSRENEDVISISDDIYLVIGDKLFIEDNPVILEEDNIYISFDILKENIDSNLFYDIEEEMVIFTDKERVSRFKVEEKKGTTNHKEFFINYPIKRIEDKIYIPDEILNLLYDLDMDYFEDTNAVIMDKPNSKYVQGEVIMEGGDIRVNFDKKSPMVLKDLPVGTVVAVFEEYENWYKVSTIDGIIGYMEKKYLKINLARDIYKVEDEPVEKEIKNKDRISLTWDYTHGKMVSAEGIEPIYGINVVSPTWFSITDEKGNIFDKGNYEYVSKYKSLGYEIWPLLDNSFDPDITYELLASSKSREKLIEKIFNIYKDYNVDGLNLDFENVYLKDKDLLTQFVRELYPVFKERGMIVSMDISPISTSENWSLSFDRRRLSETIDYLILMAYDQHWATSPVAGSVAQYTWVEKGIQGVLEEVPNEKLVLAVPFYTRLWKLEEIDGEAKISSQALSMEIANQFIEENQIELEWDEESGQYFGETTKEGIVYKIWLEDANSIELKSSLVNKYNLAGIASWRKGFETEEIWPVISNMIKLN
ncbi:glycosyl hydrolase family 18 protein [Clostridium sp. Cult2]|uniref:glycosyl hydrolase family 18 protein n=1 Tax=Clostridium sp. Cult2 TaxID=2079003 RepID=UPI001F001496|nr:glycosyl hydrolase family 18 protein [Clostridium sp. Cult2]MCF6466287.1 glycoside hydrolase [Clostridium sp. Cult2]